VIGEKPVGERARVGKVGVVRSGTGDGDQVGNRRTSKLV